MAIVFKIRRNDDGLFSTGGSYPSFTKQGKIWKQKGHLTNHLNQLRHKRAYTDCEIVPYELVETPAGPSMSIATYLQEIQDRKNKRDEDYRVRREEWEKKERRKQFEQLQKEFG